MDAGFLELLVIFLVVAGPLKPAVMFMATAAALPAADKRAIAVKTVATSTVILFVFAVFGQQLIGLFHVSLPALALAGGLILLIFALEIVLGAGHDEHAAVGDPRAMAFYPLAVPMMATPQAIVAIVVVMARFDGFAEKIPAFAALGVTMAINLAVMLAAASVGRPSAQGVKASGGIGEVVMRVVAILLAALAVQLMILGLRDLGVLPPAPAPH